ncbi:hypothetical protein [Algoriphagus hitonicola]|uniref:Uncharacterized protein n=1 Tax=Algoriphagus hitonicola TaxID=435880 RepID=A0A1I2WU33_9BACT|nr:hypothetical protein [Algoriphagus hitonicola]SFH03886.1 hypothetical protein SAMN04487988_11411 [Algoriphagus hitonicola]
MTESKKNTEEEEYGLDFRYQSKLERNSDATVLMEARLARLKNLSKEQIKKAKLYQLKLKMEEYIDHPVCDHQQYFVWFLKSYIDTIYSRRSVFAKDLALAPVSLSQIVNNHREPNEEFFLKLMIHSEKVFKGIGKFKVGTWYRVYYQEKICKTLA